MKKDSLTVRIIAIVMAVALVIPIAATAIAFLVQKG